MKTFCLIMLFLFNAFTVFSQGISDLTLDERFECQVKSLDEFLARLNGDESYPGINVDGHSRINNLAMLMDFQMPHKNESAFKENCMKFFCAIETSSRPLKDTDSLFFAVTTCCIKHQGTKKDITLILQKEMDKQRRSRWTLVGANGLQRCGIIDTTKVRGISPVEHEIHFLEMLDVFKFHAKDAMALRKSNTHIDQLSVFLALLQTKQIEVLSVDKLTYHVLSIPGFVFTIDEYARTNYNSGWLISSFSEMDDERKNVYVQKLLGK